MSKNDFNFQRDLKKAIMDADSDKINRKDLLRSTFKYWVAKLFEHIQTKKKEMTLEFNYVVTVKRNIINEFRKTDLGEYQITEKQYDDLFETTIKEILELAATRHDGEDYTSVEQTLDINPEKYINDGGLYVPEHLKKN